MNGGFFTSAFCKKYFRISQILQPEEKNMVMNHFALFKVVTNIVSMLSFLIVLTLLLSVI